MRDRFFASVILLAVAACGGSAPPPPSPPGAAAATSDRDPEDKKLDAGRKPEQLLKFAGVEPGWKVGEIAAGDGYTTEVLARAVGPSGVVYGQNSQMLIEKWLKDSWSKRLAKPVNKNVVGVTREFDDPLPPEAKDLDAVFDVLFYHDLYWLKTDREKMNAAIFKALKPGGLYIVVDHSGRPGSGTTEVESLHRIEQKLVVDDITKAGFRLAGEGDFLRNPDDKRDWNAAPMEAGERRGKSDRFVLKFVKP